MAGESGQVGLTAFEKSVIKALLGNGWRGQDIQALINTGRAAPINSGRISPIRNNASIIPATREQVEAYRQKKLMFNHITGLCPFEDERLVRSREAMILAVELFNTPRISFKSGAFSMLANVAWTYALHEYYERRGVSIIRPDGQSASLSYMIGKADCPLSKGVKQNLEALKQIRDVVEHKTIGHFDRKWLPLFQATCLNFEIFLTETFGRRLSLGSDLGFVLQFSRLSTDQLGMLQGFDIPEHIAALDANLASKLAEGEGDNLEYQFKVVYTLASASKAKAHFQFLQPNSAEGKEIQNILIRYKPADDIWPFKPKQVVEKVRQASGRAFTSDKHQRAWKMYKARPRRGAADPAATNKDYCLFHPPYDSYTYSQPWVDFLVAEIADEEKWAALSAYKD